MFRDALAGDPGQGPFDDPMPWQQDESGRVVGALHDLQHDTQSVAGPADQLAGVATIGPDQPNPAMPAVALQELRTLS